MRTPAEIIKEAKISSIILKNNIESLKLHFKESYLIKWFIDFVKLNEIEDEEIKQYYDICQNIDSLTLLWESQFFPDTKTHFFLELINTYQTLQNRDENKNIPYYSYSQACTTYCLKILNKYKIIEILSLNSTNEHDLTDLQQAFGKKIEDSKCSKMYEVFFLKNRNLTEEDLPLLKQIASFLQIDFSAYNIIKEEEKIKLHLNKKYRKIKVLTSFQREQIRDILVSIKKEIFCDLKNKKKRQEIAEILKIVNKKYSK